MCFVERKGLRHWRTVAVGDEVRCSNRIELPRNVRRTWSKKRDLSSFVEIQSLASCACLIACVSDSVRRMRNDRPGLAEAVDWWLARPGHRLMQARKVTADDLGALSELAGVALFEARRRMLPASERAEFERKRQISRAWIRNLEGPKPRATLGSAARSAPKFRTKRPRA